MRKLLVAILLVAMLVTALSACAGSKSTTTTDGQGDEKNDHLANENNKNNENSNENNNENSGNDTSIGIRGTELAKILLANGRLDVNALSTSGGLFTDGVETLEALKEETKRSFAAASDKYNEAALLTAFGPMQTLDASQKVIEAAEFCRSYEVFANTAENIVGNAEMGIELINYVKKYVRVVDKWVKTGAVVGQEILLHVEKNSEMIIERYEDFWRFCRRYKNEKGQDVYELIYQNSMSTIRSLYIKGERYELSHTFDDIHDVTVATNTKGYWEIFNNRTRMSETQPEIRNTSEVFVMKDDLCYAASYGFDEYATQRVTIVNKDRTSDILSSNKLQDMTSFGLNLGAFSGIKQIVETEHSFGRVILDSGEAIKNESYLDGKVMVRDTLIQYSAWGEEVTLMIDVMAEGEDPYAILKQLLNEWGLTCKYDIDTVFVELAAADRELENMKKYYLWHGYSINDPSELDKAFEVDMQKTEELVALCERVKDAEIVDMSGASLEDSKLDISFAQITENNMEGVSYSDRVISISKGELALKDELFLIEGEKYSVFFAFKSKSDGKLTNIVLDGTPAVTHEGGSEIKVKAAENVTIEIPLMAIGEYVPVAYIGTADGIRVSQIVEIGFGEIAAEKFERENLCISISKAENSSLLITYEERIDATVTIVVNAPVSYEELLLKMSQLAYTYGEPDESLIEKLNGVDTFEELSPDSTDIGEGQYRIAFNVINGEHSATGYLYADIVIEEIEDNEEIEEGEEI